MAKYIIEFEDEPCMRKGGVNYYTCKSVPWCELGETIINKLTPFTEPNREAIENEVWSLAREIAYCMSLQECIDTGMLHDDDIYDSASGVLEKLTYQEAKAKFEAWKAEREQIRVGDEVIDKDVGKAIVTNIVFEVCSVLWFDGSVSEDVPLGDLHKTGRHFDEVEELLEKMKEGDRT